MWYTAYWVELRPGQKILSPDHREFLLVETREGWWRATDKAGQEYRWPPQKPTTPCRVWWDDLPDADFEEVLGWVARDLGGRPIDTVAEQANPAMYWQAPLPTSGNAKQRMNEYGHHLSWWHRTYTGDLKTLAQFRECHDTLHDGLRAPLGHIPHEHRIGGPRHGTTD